jgi:hypothetical protein
MRTPTSLRVTASLLGFVLIFVGLGGLAIANLWGGFRIAAGCCLAFGVLLSRVTFFVSAWDRGPVGRLRRSPRGYYWLLVAAVVLWFGIMPLTFLWLYDRLHRH